MTETPNYNETLVINTNDPDGTKAYIEKVLTFRLISEYDPKLKICTPHFDFDNPPTDPNAFASSLVETCKLNKGIGLASPQCGYSYRVFVMGTGDEYVAFYNPVIIKSSEEKEISKEGCLSYQYLYISINRPTSITVSYQDYMGNFHENDLVGLAARCFQHELDHLNGITFVDIAGSVSLMRAKKKREKLMKHNPIKIRG